MKRTRFTFQVTVGSAAPVNEPWPRAHTRFLHEFKPRAERYRRRKRIGLGLLLGFMIGMFVVMQTTFPGFVRLSVVVVLVVGLMASLLIYAFGLKLRCPACRKRLEPATGLYCPQCGSSQFEHGSHRSPSTPRDAYCPECNGRIAEEDGDSARSYRIRGCSHCGVMLDEKGL
jgi:hypothetical protein